LFNVLVTDVTLIFKSVHRL